MRLAALSSLLPALRLGGCWGLLPWLLPLGRPVLRPSTCSSLTSALACRLVRPEPEEACDPQDHVLSYTWLGICKQCCRQDSKPLLNRARQTPAQHSPPACSPAPAPLLLAPAVLAAPAAGLPLGWAALAAALSAAAGAGAFWRLRRRSCSWRTRASSSCTGSDKQSVPWFSKPSLGGRQAMQTCLLQQPLRYSVSPHETQAASPMQAAGCRVISSSSCRIVTLIVT